MMYPYMTLSDDTEIVHSEVLADGKVKVYIEKPIFQGFNHATCYLPRYEWEDVVGFTQEEIQKFQKLIEANSHLIMEFAAEGGFENASNF